MDIERRKLKSSLLCLNCGTEIVSKHRHDYVCCDCEGNNRICLDGGTIYTRILLSTNDYSYQDTSIYDDEKHETRRNNLYWGIRYDKELNLLPETQWKLIKDLDTSHIENILKGNFVESNKFYKEVFINEIAYRRLLENNP